MDTAESGREKEFDRSSFLSTNLPQVPDLVSPNLVSVFPKNGHQLILI